MVCRSTYQEECEKETAARDEVRGRDWIGMLNGKAFGKLRYRCGEQAVAGAGIQCRDC